MMLSCLLAWTASATCLAAPDAPASDSPAVSARVAAVLQAHCVRCHRDDARKGGLSLATIGAMTRGGDNGPAVVPSKPDEGLLLEKIAGDAPEMPKGSAPLKTEDVAAIEAWIRAGAPWPDGLVLKEPAKDPKSWWAFRPLERPPVPAVAPGARARNEVDAFILDALSGRGLGLGPAADRRTLIRRLSYDLIGLPPTASEVRDFVDDPSPDAYERLVDRLLDSPAYGERWGRHWLDVVHYADTHGYDKDKRRDHAWPYRDYVIRAFNDDRPYGRFVEEQVAGDVLFPDNPQAVVATGFVAAGPWDFVGHAELREGTVDKEKTRLIDRDDMVANTISTFNSLTAHCARCHDHKFDPISQSEYYRLQAVFSGVDRGDRPYETPETRREGQALAARRASLVERSEEVRRAMLASSSPELRAIEARLRELRAERANLASPPAGESPTNGYHSAIFDREDRTAWVQLDLGKVVPLDEVRLFPARPTDFADTPGFGFPLRWRVEASDDPTFAKPLLLWEEDREPSEPVADEPRVIRPPASSARHLRITATRLWKRTGDFVLALSEVQVISAGSNVATTAVVSAQDSIEGGRWSAKALVDGRTSREPIPPAGDFAAERRFALSAEIDRLDHERRRAFDQLLPPSLVGELSQIAREIAAVDRRSAEIVGGAQVYGLLSHAPRPIRLLKRGEVEQPGEVMAPGALSCISGLDADFSDAGESEGLRRARLARWLSDRNNVLTWRSVVNRTWHFHFGKGLVDTPNDFGRNGATPSHPELLDWLAVEFRDGGQSLKSLHRLIVRSETYRQSSLSNEAGARIDAENRLLWRQNRRRLEAEALRDAVLATSGSLVPRMGGPGYEPFRFKDDHSPTYDHEDVARIVAPENFRRTVYRFAVRSVPDPFVECLDGADPNVNTPVRNTTITPLQALALLNDPFMLDQAGRFAARMRESGGDLAAQVGRAVETAFGRPATPNEREALTRHAERHGLAGACRVILNMNEFVFVD